MSIFKTHPYKPSASAPGTTQPKRKSLFVQNEPGRRPKWRRRTPADDAQEAAAKGASPAKVAQAHAPAAAFAPKEKFREEPYLRANAATFLKESFDITLADSDRVTSAGLATLRKTISRWCQRRYACSTREHRNHFKDDLLAILGDPDVKPEDVAQAMTLQRADFDEMSVEDKNHVMRAGFKLRD